MSNRIVATPGDRLELLETFVRIADAGGITAAAKSLEAAQPTVSRRLQQLEAMLDVKLIDRSTHALSLTPAGARLLPEAREVVARWRGLEERFDAAGDAVGGVVRVAASREIGAGLMPALLAEFLSAHPGVRVDLRFFDGSPDSLGEEPDFILSEGRGDGRGVDEHMVVKEIGRVRRVLAAGPNLAAEIAAARGVAIGRCEPLALEGAPLVSAASLYRGSVRFQGRGGESQEVRFERVAAVDGLEPAVNLAVLGVGVAVLPEWRIAPFLATGALERLAADWQAQSAPVTLIWSPSRFRSAAASAFFELVREELPALLQAE